jgi:hypothetical protein
MILVQGLVLWSGMRSVPGGKNSLFLGVVRRMNCGNCHRVVLMVFGMTALVRAGRAAFMGGGYRLATW